MPVQVEQEQLDHCRVALTIGVPPEEIQKAVETVYNRFAKQTTAPGFRPGKAPRHLVKRFIDEDRVRELAFEQALNNAFRDALRQENLRLYAEAEPSVELPEEQLDPEQGFSFKATVALEPHVHLGDLEGLSGRRVVAKISDEDVDKELDRYREQLATYEETTEPAQDGDRVRVELRITLDGETITETGEGQPVLLQVGANLPEFDTNLTGVTGGEEKTFNFTYPEDYTEEQFRGKTAEAYVKVGAVLRRAVPEANEEFATKLGFETLEALRDRVREGLQAQADALADQELNDELVREVTRRSHAHYPSEMLEHEVSHRTNELMKALERRNATLDEYLESEQKDLVTFQGEVREEARETLERTLVLLELARQNGITVSEKDVEAEVKARAEAEQVKLAQMRRLLNETGEIGNIRNRIFYRKVADFLRSKAEVREVEA